MMAEAAGMIVVLEKCTKQLVPNVKRNAKFLLNQAANVRCFAASVFPNAKIAGVNTSGILTNIAKASSRNTWGFVFFREFI
jgi:hypothetical protein